VKVQGLDFGEAAMTPTTEPGSSISSKSEGSPGTYAANTPGASDGVAGNHLQRTSIPDQVKFPADYLDCGRCPERSSGIGATQPGETVEHYSGLQQPVVHRICFTLPPVEHRNLIPRQGEARRRP